LFNGEFGASYRIKCETNENRFQFYIKPKTFAKYLGVEIEMTYRRYGNETIENISEKSMSTITEKANALINQPINIKGSVKDQKEIVGKTVTTLTRVSPLK